METVEQLRAELELSQGAIVIHELQAKKLRKEIRDLKLELRVSHILIECQHKRLSRLPWFIRKVFRA